MKVLTRFQSSYDKYLFEGIINPEDYYSFVGTWSGTALNGNIQNEVSKDSDIVSLYVLNTLDHNIKIEPQNPDNILTKFFSSMKTSPVLKNLLLISIQHPRVLNDVIEYFSSLEKVHRPDKPIVVYTISSLTLFSQLNDQIKNIIEYYGKHTYIDLSLALTAIELFKRRKLADIYGSELKEFKGIGYDLLNHTDKKIHIQASPKIIYVPKIKIDDNVLKNISDFLDKNSKSEECFAKRLVPLTPKFNYRLYDKLETFYRRPTSIYKSLEAELLGTEVPIENKFLYNVLIIRTSELKGPSRIGTEGFSSKSPEISFKILLYISIFKWNLIFFENIEPSVPEVSECYEQLTSLYNDRTFGSGTEGSKSSEAKLLKMSKTELKKLNPDYSLLRTEKEIKDFENNMKTIFPDKLTPPHIMIDSYDDIKTYLKKLETSLSMDKIVMRVLEL